MSVIPLGGGPPFSVALSTTSAVVVRACWTRKLIVFSNASTIGMWLARADNATANAGIYLAPNGGSLVDQPDMFGRIYSGPWAALSASGTPTLSISEDR